MSESKSNRSAFDMQKWLDAFSVAENLSKREMSTLLRMSRYANYKTGGGIYPSTDAVAVATGIHVAHLKGTRGAIASLTAKGWLIKCQDATKTTPAYYRLGYGPHRVDLAPTVRKEVAETATSPAEAGPDEVADLATSEVAETATSEVAETATSEVADLATRTTDEQRNEHRNEQRTAREAAPIVQGVVVPDEDDADPDTEARELADHLADVIGSTASQRPAPTRKWIAAFTELMSRENITRRQVEYVIDYLPEDDFWSGLVFDAPYFVGKYDQIAGKARNHLRRQAKPTRTFKQQASHDQMARWRARAEELDRLNSQKALTS